MKKAMLLFLLLVPFVGFAAPAPVENITTDLRAEMCKPPLKCETEIKFETDNTPLNKECKAKFPWSPEYPVNENGLYSLLCNKLSVGS